MYEKPPKFIDWLSFIMHAIVIVLAIPFTIWVFQHDPVIALAFIVTVACLLLVGISTLDQED